ncbi:MAG TPA: hypothetical protein VN931_05075 [Fibrobacteria bacterium]|nr:hypothetical protein [Fibrobacteria bacterium]
MATDVDDLVRRWEEAASTHPVVGRFLPWALTLLDAARVSAGCDLGFQADRLLAKARRRLENLLETPVGSGRIEPLEVRWEAPELPKKPDGMRQERLGRRVRSMRSHRLPFRGEGHPQARGLAWGPYNRQSAVAEALSAVAAVDPLWVDDLLERERSLRSIDLLLGLPG